MSRVARAKNLLFSLIVSDHPDLASSSLFPVHHSIMQTVWPGILMFVHCRVAILVGKVVK
jgi:hypothetical protein